MEKIKYWWKSFYGFFGGWLGLASGPLGFGIAGLSALRDDSNQKAWTIAAFSSLAVYAVNMTWQRNKFEASDRQKDLTIESNKNDLESLRKKVGEYEKTLDDQETEWLEIDSSFKEEKRNEIQLMVRIKNNHRIKTAKNVTLELMEMQCEHSFGSKLPVNFPVEEEREISINPGGTRNYLMFYASGG